MQLNLDAKYQKRTSVGKRLNLAILAILSFYIISTVIGIHALTKQSEGFDTLSGVYFERAMTAAELTRDAEVIAAEAFESLFGTERSGNSNNQYQTFLLAYETARARLHTDIPEEKKQLEQLDYLKAPYYESLEGLRRVIDKRDQLREKQQSLLQSLYELTQALSDEKGSELSPAYSALQTAIGFTSLALSSEKHGQLHRLNESAQAAFEQAKGLAISPQEQQLIDQAIQVSKTVFALREPVLLNARATLAAARNARASAQRLSVGSYNYFKTVKDSAEQATAAHKRNVNQALIIIFLVSLVFIISTLLIIWFIRQHVVQRLNKLSTAMAMHVEGKEMQIPAQGDDEIAEMGNAFSVFVLARHFAEADLVKARKETEAINAQLLALNKSLEKMSLEDGLTQIANRRCFDERYLSEWRRAERIGVSISIIMLDVDFFKSFNDQYGHPLGDSCLVQVAQTLRQSLRREGDFVARYGGEEFIVLLLGYSQQEAAEVANRLLSAVEQQAIVHETNPKGIVTVSLGVATTTPTIEMNHEQLIRQADEALYQAKKLGRARVEVSPSL
jgi:diguanylate cyclase (GGDEF)-like protein